MASFDPSNYPRSASSIENTLSQKNSQTSKKPNLEPKESPTSNLPFNITRETFFSHQNQSAPLMVKVLGKSPSPETTHLREMETQSTGFLQKTKEWLFSFSSSSTTDIATAEPSSKEKFGKMQSTYGTPHVVVPQKAFSQFKQKGLTALREQGEKCKLEIKSVSSKLPTSKIQSEIVLKRKYPNYSSLISLMDTEHKEFFQQQRMVLSKTIARSPAQRKQWETVDGFISELAKNKIDISLENLDMMQKMLNKTTIYLDDIGRNKKDELNEYVGWFNDQLAQCNKGEQNPIIFAAHAYQYFLHMHPYSDGNGRMGRFLMDLALERSGLPPACLTGSVVNDDVDGLVTTIEHDVDELVLAIKKGIVEVCKQSGQPHPFEG